MARLPTADNSLPNVLPRTTAKSGAYTPRAMTSPVSGLRQAGEELMLQAKREQEKIDNYELNKRKVDYLRGESELRMKYEADPDYMTAPDRMRAETDVMRKGLFQGLKPEHQQEFDLWSQQQGIQSYEVLHNQSRAKHRDAEWGRYTQDEEDLLAALGRARLNGDNEGAIRIGKMLRTSADGLAAIDPSKLDYLTKQREGGWEKQSGKMMYDQLPPEVAARYGEMSPPKEVMKSDYATRLGKIEGTGKNPNSSASGKYQFIDSTWIDVVKKHAPEVAQGKSDSEILALKKNDDGFKDAMFEAFTNDNATYLASKLGRAPNDGELYLAHQQGAGGAIKLLTNPDTPAKDLVGLDGVMLNLPKSMQGRADTITGKEFAEYWMKKAGGSNTSIVMQEASGPSYFEINRWRDADPIGFKNAQDAKRRELISNAAQYQKILSEKVFDDLAKASSGQAPEQPISKADFDVAFPLPSDSERAYEDYLDQRQFGITMNEMKDMPPLWQEKTLEAMRPSADSPNYARELDQYEKAAKGINSLRTEFIKDPVTYAVQAGIAPSEMAQIDFSLPQKDVVEQLRKRGELAQTLRDTYKVPGRIFTNNEIGLLKSAFDNGTTKETVALLAAMNSGLDDNQRRILSQELADNNAPMMAVALAQPIDVANAVIEGYKSKIELDRTSIDYIDQQLSGTTFDAEMFVGQKEAVSSYYKKLLKDNGLTGKEVDIDLIDIAIEKTLGPIRSISPNLTSSHSQVFSFKRDNGEWVSAGRLNDIFSAMTDDMLISQNGELPFAEGLPVHVDEIMSEARIYSAGDGKYGFQFIIGRHRMPITYRDGVTPYVVDVREIDKIIKSHPGKIRDILPLKEDNPYRME